MATAATYRSFLGVAKEATKGTGVAATDYIPVKTMTPVDDVKMLEDLGWRGAAVKQYDHITGVTGSTFEFGSDVFADTFGYPLMGLLGDVTVTGASAPFTHSSGVKNSGDMQPVSWSLSDFDGTNTRQFAGFQFSEVNTKFTAEGLFEYTAKGEGFASAVVTNPTQSYSAQPPLANWICVVKVGGSTVSNTVDGECNMKRPIQRIYTLNNVQTPYKVWVGPLEVTGKLTFTMDDDSQLTHYLANDKPSLSLDWQQGVSAALVEVKFVMSKCGYKVAKVERGKDFVQVVVDYTALANSTDVGASGGFSPIKATLQNAKPSGTYQ